MKEFLWKVISVCKYLLFLCCIILIFRPTVFLTRFILLLLLFVLTYFLIIAILEALDE